MESTFQKIIRKTGRKPVQCKCNRCKSQCEVAPCLGTPQDILKLIDAGYADKILPTVWAAGVAMKITDKIVNIYASTQISRDKIGKGPCIFYKEGLCELHDKGLKPTEGRLSHHSHTPETFTSAKSLSWNVAKEWLDPANKPVIEEIERKLKLNNQSTH